MARAARHKGTPVSETRYTGSDKEVTVATSVLMAEGRMTLPREVRDRLGLHEGDKVEFCFDDQGRVVLRPASLASEAPLGRLPGMLRDFAPERPVTVEEMDEAVLRAVAEKRGKPTS